jgi:D-tyrosyl-tRNA(Tyr) deacylase
MKVLIQRVKSAKVEVDEKSTGEIGQGYLLFVCIEVDDTSETLKKAAEKIGKIRINEDDQQKMNLDIKQIKGSILSVSQFTLSWDGSRGHRPSFDRSMPPEKAQEMFDDFNNHLRMQGIKVATGVFGAEMQVSLQNDGPVTFHLEF